MRKSGWLGIVTVILWSLPCLGYAQDTDPSSVLDAELPTSRFELLPHRLVLDSRTRSTTLTLINRSAHPTTVDLQVVFAYSVWSRGRPWDTTLFTSHWESLLPHDTVVPAPHTADGSAAAWITGVPTQVTLQPRETRHLSVQLTPPSALVQQEYWARILATVKQRQNPNNPGKPKDTHTIYTLPIHGTPPAPLRDSTIIFYRPGAMRMELRRAGRAAAALDEDNLPRPPVGCPCRRVWYRLPVRVAGNAVYQGTLHVWYEYAQSSDTIWAQDWELTLYHDAVIHGWSEWHTDFQPGKYKFIARFDNQHSELSRGDRLPMRAIADTVFFDVLR